MSLAFKVKGMFAEKRVVIVVALVVICGLLLSSASPVIEAKTVSAATATPTKTPTTFTISAPPSAVVKQYFSITGKLTANGAPLKKQIVYLQRLSGKTWTIITAQYVTTGTYSFSWRETTANTYQYRTTYSGSATYASATSPVVQVQVRAPTRLSAAMSLTSVPVDQNFTINGTLNTTSGTLVSGAIITLQKNVSGTWTNVTTNVTHANGNYRFSNNKSAVGTYQYQNQHQLLHLHQFQLRPNSPSPPPT
jgi:5-hydroxyisourate hydrolase-like protein (transthyretin family)